MVFNHERLQPKQGGMPWGKGMVMEALLHVLPVQASRWKSLEFAGAILTLLQKPFESLFISLCLRNELKVPGHATCTTELPLGTLGHQQRCAGPRGEASVP